MSNSKRNDKKSISRSLRKTVLKLICFGIMCSLLVHMTNAQDYIVTGKLTFKRHASTNDLSGEKFLERLSPATKKILKDKGINPADRKNTENYSFKTYITPTSWRIEIDPLEQAPFKHYELAFDRGLLYEYKEFQLPPSADNEKSLKIRNKGEGMIMLGSVPNPHSFHTMPIWLALASKEYLNSKAKSSKMPAPWITGRSTNPSSEPELVDAKWIWLDGSNFLSTITYYSMFFPADKLDPAAKFIVTKTRKIGNATFPEEFTYMQARVNPKDGEDPIFLSYSASIADVTLLEKPLPDIKPKIAVPIVVMDYRYSGRELPGDCFQYIATNTWPNESQITNSSSYKLMSGMKSRKENRLNQRKENQYRPLIFALIILTSFSLLILKLKQTK